MMTAGAIMRGWRRVTSPEPDTFEVQVRRRTPQGWIIQRRLGFSMLPAATRQFDVLRGLGRSCYTDAGGYRLVLVRVSGR